MLLIMLSMDLKLHWNLGPLNDKIYTIYVYVVFLILYSHQCINL